MVTDFGSNGAAPSFFPETLQQARDKLSAIVSSSTGHFADEPIRDQLNAWRLEASAAAFESLQARKSASNVGLVQELVVTLAKSGANEAAVDESVRRRAADLATKGWAGKAAAALLVPAWQGELNIALREAPPALIPVFATYCFTVPALIASSAEADGHGRIFLAALQDLAAMAKANRGSTAVNAALAVYRADEMPEALAISTKYAAAIRSHRSRLVSALVRASSQPGAGLMLPRTDRALRIGVVAQSLPPSGATLSLLPMLERIGAERTEVILAVLQPGDSPVERQLASRGAKSLPLAGDLEQMVQALRDASLDAAVFLVEGAWLDNPLISISLQRVAPLQLLHDGSGLPSDAPQFDLFTATPEALASDPAKTADRPMLLSDAGVLARNELRTAENPSAWTKETIGVNPTEFVYAAFAPLARIEPPVVEVWAQVLAAAPEARLAIFSPPPAADFSTERFCASLSRTLDSRGVDSKRVLVFSDVAPTTHEQRMACVAAVEAVLDVSTGSDAATLFAAVVSGCPVVSSAARSAAAVLRAAGGSELIAHSMDEIVLIATRLYRDAAWRNALRSRLAETGPKLAAQHDSFRASEAFCQAIETAYDERSGSERDFRRGGLLRVAPPDHPAAVASEAAMMMQFGAVADAERKLRSLLLCPADLANHRKLLAAALSRRDRHAEAADLLVTVVEEEPTDPSNWFELGLAARQAGQSAVALQAFQQGLQIDPRRTESWRILAELADELGNDELKQEISAMIRQLHDPAEPAIASAPAADLNLSL